jgi:hypothetical protein
MARSYWEAASRCDPSEDARSAAAGAKQYRVRIFRPVGVIRQPRVVAAPVDLHRKQRLPVRVLPTMRRHLPLDGEAGEFVPEPHRVPIGYEQPAGQQIVQVRGGRRGNRVQQPGLDVRPDQRCRLRCPPRGLAQPSKTRKDGVPGRLRQLTGTRLQHLGDEERDAAREPM